MVKLKYETFRHNCETLKLFTVFLIKQNIDIALNENANGESLLPVS